MRRIRIALAAPAAAVALLSAPEAAHAQAKGPLIDTGAGAHRVLLANHPSPLSASRGFFGSRPFSRVNRLLVDQGGTPLDWSLPQ